MKGEKWTYVFDSFYHKSATDFLTFAEKELGTSKSWINCDCAVGAKGVNDAIVERFKKKNDIEGELGEEQLAELTDASANH